MTYHPSNYFLVGELAGVEGYFVNAPITPQTGDLPPEVLEYSIDPPPTPKVTLIGVDPDDVVYLRFADKATAYKVLGLPLDEDEV